MWNLGGTRLFIFDFWGGTIARFRFLGGTCPCSAAYATWRIHCSCCTHPAKRVRHRQLTKVHQQWDALFFDYFMNNIHEVVPTAMDTCESTGLLSIHWSDQQLVRVMKELQGWKRSSFGLCCTYLPCISSKLKGGGAGGAIAPRNLSAGEQRRPPPPPPTPHSTILYIQNSQRALFMLAMRN